MNKKRMSMHLGIGATSIFMIFVIMIMCVLAILAYLKANSYYVSTLRQVENVASYYECESKILQEFQELKASDLDTALSTVKQIDGNYLLVERVNSHQQIELTFIRNDTSLEMMGLKTVNQEE